MGTEGHGTRPQGRGCPGRSHVFADLDAKLGAAMLKMVEPRGNKYSDPLRATIAATVISREDEGFNTGERAYGIELLWLVCEQYAVRGQKDQLFSITDLQKVELRENGLEGLRRFYAHWTLTLSRLPAEVKARFPDTILELFVKQLHRSSSLNALMTFYAGKKAEDEKAHGYEWPRKQVFSMLHEQAMARNRDAHEKGAGKDPFTTAPSAAPAPKSTAKARAKAAAPAASSSSATATTGKPCRTFLESVSCKAGAACPGVHDPLSRNVRHGFPGVAVAVEEDAAGAAALALAFAVDLSRRR